jgi:hypothetical protein
MAGPAMSAIPRLLAVLAMRSKIVMCQQRKWKTTTTFLTLRLQFPPPEKWLKAT